MHIRLAVIRRTAGWASTRSVTEELTVVYEWARCWRTVRIGPRKGANRPATKKHVFLSTFARSGVLYWSVRLAKALAEREEEQACP